jgi:hypothetical protein
MNRTKMTMSTTKMTAKTSSGHMRKPVVTLNEHFLVAPIGPAAIMNGELKLEVADK